MRKKKRINAKTENKIFIISISILILIFIILIIYNWKEIFNKIKKNKKYFTNIK